MHSLDEPSADRIQTTVLRSRFVLSKRDIFVQLGETFATLVWRMGISL